MLRSLSITTAVTGAAAVMSVACSGTLDPTPARSRIPSHALSTGGPTLTPQHSGTTNRLQAVSPVNRNVVWASGVGGTFVVTTDGGQHWRRGVVPGARDLEFRDVEGVSANVAYLMSAGTGSASRIYKTTDGGRTWALHFQNKKADAFYDCFDFWTPQRGITFSDPVNRRFPVIRTNDGRRWHDIGDRLPRALEGEFGFAASGTCVATQGLRQAWITTGGADRARILATTDGGQTWRAFNTPLVSNPSAGGFTVAFRTGSHGIVAGGDLNPENPRPRNRVATSSDGGQTWQLVRPPPFDGAVFGLSYVPERGRTVVITGPAGAAWSGNEGEEGWRVLPGVEGFWAVAFVDESAGWLVGTEGRILKVSFLKPYDVIVLGLGGMGSATLFHLARRGVRVLGLERFDVVHEYGSSHGLTRIIRLAYWEHPSYVALLRRSYELWRELETLSGERLLHITGSVDAGPEEGLIFSGALKSSELHRLPHEVMNGGELHRRFPGYRLPREMKCLFQPDGGFLLPERCNVAHVAQAQAHGAEVHCREPVLDWGAGSGRVWVRTERARYEAGRLVICAGAWASKLVPDLNGLAVPERQVLAWLQPERPEYFHPDTFPVFNLEVDEGRYYGLPSFLVPGFKFGKYHHRGETVDADLVNREPGPEDEELLRAFARRYFPEGAGPTMMLKTCLFTNSPDGHFILDLHPDKPEVAIAAGFSGHGYKFCGVIGEVMADLAQHGQPGHDIELFRLRRFAGKVERLGSSV